MAIRPATANDLDAVSALMPRQVEMRAALTADHPALIEDGVVRVLTQDSAVVGILVLLDRPDHLLVGAMEIDPFQKDKGFEKAMLTFAESEARNRGYDEVRLNASEATTGTIALCRSLGYREMTRRDRDGDRPIHMRKIVL